MSSDEELWQGYDPQGRPTGAITKKEAQDGALHAASHIWIWKTGADGIEILMQRRALGKPTWPGFYDISAAGHVDADETPLEAALRETEEEIGARLQHNALTLLFVHRAYLVAPGGIIENEFQWVYGYQAHDEIQFSHEDGEVESVAWIALEELKAITEDKIPNKQIVPHGAPYFVQLIAELKRQYKHENNGG